MPFREAWSDAARRAVEEACAEARLTYVRGDLEPEPGIIRSIWSNIARASLVVVDLTALNLNVAIELGMAHTLGRSTLLVGQGDVVNRLPPSLSHERVHGYSPADMKSTLGAAVRDALSRAV